MLCLLYYAIRGTILQRWETSIFFRVARTKALHGPRSEIPARPGPVNSRTCPTQAHPDVKPFYAGPARAQPGWCD